MLKLVLATMIMTLCVKNWLSVQLGVLFFTFLFSLSLVNEFIVERLGCFLFLDYIRHALIFLSLWITALMVSASQIIFQQNKYPNLFLLIVILLLLGLVLTFSCIHYIIFYIFFEACLVPALILICGWGLQPERLQAGIYMIFYTLFGSLPLIISLLRLGSGSGTLVLSMTNISFSLSRVVILMWYFFSVFAFIVKMPIFIVHLWLPKAHVEAPVAGSMVLAGVLLKLGAYGLIRINYLFLQWAVKFNWFWVRAALVGGFLARLICMRQTDTKALIAYSSVAHMRLVICGLVLANWWGLAGGIAVIIGHGLCSSGLFCLANMVYERVQRRRLLISKGLLNIIPSLALWWFLLRVSNMAAPPTLNLLGEIRLIITVISWRPFTVHLIFGLSFFRAAYRLYLFAATQHGKIHSGLYACCRGKVREYLVLFLHWFPLNILILFR